MVLLQAPSHPQKMRNGGNLILSSSSSSSSSSSASSSLSASLSSASLEPSWLSRFGELRVYLKEWKNVLISALPFLMYLFVFKYYVFLREYTGMSEITKPNRNVLPYLEELAFNCLPHRKLAQFANPVLDFLAAIPYLVHFPLPLLFAGYLYTNARRRRQIYPFLWCAGWVNFLAVIVQFVFPTAPPWFADSAVFDDKGHLIAVANNEAGFERLDKMFNVQLFHSIYSASPVKFGAMPSLHVAWPAIILVSKPWFSDTVGVLHVVWIAWAALYSNHHYGVDAMAGIFLVFLVNYCMTRIYCPFPVYSPDADNVLLHHHQRTTTPRQQQQQQQQGQLQGQDKLLLSPHTQQQQQQQQQQNQLLLSPQQQQQQQLHMSPTGVHASAQSLIKGRANSQSVPVIFQQQQQL